MKKERTTPVLLPGYSVAEEIANAATHGVGLVLALVGSVVLAWVAVDALGRATAGVFSLSLVLLYCSSTFYHVARNEAVKRRLRLLDHAAIYLLIAGTYTPIALVAIGGTTGLGLVAAVWLLAVLGIVLTFISLQRFKVLSMVLYLAMGWLVVFTGHRMLESLGGADLVLILVGGICYTGGLAFYGWRSLRFSHSVWHLFVLAGSVLHFVAVLRIVA